jgi:hypothetical protein
MPPATRRLFGRGLAARSAAPEEEMGSNLSVYQIIAELEAQIARHHAQVDLHTKQEAFHRERRAHHAAELEKLSGVLEDFRKTSSAVLEVTGDSRKRRDDQRDFGSSRPRFGRLILAILEDKGAEEAFSASDLAGEIQRRYGDRLDKAKRVEPRSIAAQLRRMVDRGEIRLTREGRSYHEALYAKGRGRG